MPRTLVLCVICEKQNLRGRLCRNFFRLKAKELRVLYKSCFIVGKRKENSLFSFIVSFVDLSLSCADQFYRPRPIREDEKKSLQQCWLSSLPIHSTRRKPSPFRSSTHSGFESAVLFEEEGGR